MSQFLGQCVPQNLKSKQLLFPFDRSNTEVWGMSEFGKGCEGRSRYLSLKPQGGGVHLD